MNKAKVTRALRDAGAGGVTVILEGGDLLFRFDGERHLALADAVVEAIEPGTGIAGDKIEKVPRDWKPSPDTCWLSWGKGQRH